MIARINSDCRLRDPIDIVVAVRVRMPLSSIPVDDRL
jgi:hypothetical protein